MTPTGFISTILFSVFTGWITIWIVLQMLFHPRKPTRFWGIIFQGIISKNQQIIAEKLGHRLGKELLSFNEIEKKVTDPENLQKLRPEIEAHIDHFLRHKLKEVFPMLSMLLGEKTILQLKEAFLLELESLFPVLMKSYMNKLEQDIDLEKIVTEKIAGFSSDKLEGILDQVSKKEFKLLQLIGAFTGLVIGLVQTLVIFLSL